MKYPEFIDKNGTFTLEDADLNGQLYFPLAGEYGLKSCVSPTLAGDAKVDQNHFLYPPVSIEDLTAGRLSRNFWVVTETGEIWSASGGSASQNMTRMTEKREPCRVTAGFMWHRTERTNTELGLRSEITSFIPYDHNTEVHVLRITNLGTIDRVLTVVPALPLYGRSADNIRDHRHVTSLLGRASVTERGIQDHPTFSFDERGHRLADAFYYVEGYREDGTLPAEFFPVLDDFVGSGTPDWPETVTHLAEIRKKGYHSGAGGIAPGSKVGGQEIMGAFRFEDTSLAPGETATYIIYAGISRDPLEYERAADALRSPEKVKACLEQTRNYWLSKVNIKITTGDPAFDGYMRWIAFQPELRRIFGCSFLPHHDYGRGGRGWRDLWQDCLALLLMDPSGVKQMLLGNFGGVRIDGTNATIIGSGVGEFQADRNAITRVWMDHGFWPLVTTGLYIHSTGDAGILNEECTYFDDPRIRRGTARKENPPAGDNLLRDAAGQPYKGSILEHILLQNLTAFWEVGEHGNIRLRDADWNDALDMAGDRGESVAFTAAYAGNLTELADLCDSGKWGDGKTMLLEELEILLRDETIYDTPGKKQDVLDEFLTAVSEKTKFRKKETDLQSLAENLRRKARSITGHLRQQEWIRENDKEGWFNGYYDNSGKALDLTVPGKKMMTLTGQVFSVMYGIAGEEQVRKICAAADKRLYDESSGGYRLNTDFGSIRTDMGRMFGFAYGEKENGAVFSHMAVMYANALYRRGFAKEGYKALKALYDASMNYRISRIYPGIPEYFGRGGRGLYSYLTGAASWYLLTVTTEMFGIRGVYGDLEIRPALMREQFGTGGVCSIEMEYGCKPFRVEIRNPQKLECGTYRIAECRVDGKAVPAEEEGSAFRLPRETIDLLDSAVRHSIEILLG
ncbi:MAG: cellobiose phosphorylase [Lachnospiraceae bacterium]|nr:cellobiose phosphorylase [Lachnospiraceae bacterium]